MSLFRLTWSSDIRSGMEVVTVALDSHRNMLPALRRFRLYMSRQTALMFKNLGGKGGGSFRGVSWPWFAHQYTRKTDGATVPAEGGVPRLARLKEFKGTKGFLMSMRGSFSSREKGGKGKRAAYLNEGLRNRMQASTVRERNVRAKLRPSGMRVTGQSKVLQDTGLLRRKVTTEYDINQEGPHSLTWGTAEGYVAKQHRRRPIMFYTAEDLGVLQRILLRHCLGLSKNAQETSQTADFGGAF